MNRNGTPALFLIYLMTTLPAVLVDRRSTRLAEATPATPSVNLYSTFKDRLNATANFAQSEYDAKTSAVVTKIYDVAGKILKEQLKRERANSGMQKPNFVDDFDEEPDSPPRSHDILPPAIAPHAAEDAKKNPPQPIDGADRVDSRFIRRAIHRPGWVSRRMRPAFSIPLKEDSEEECESPLEAKELQAKPCGAALAAVEEQAVSTDDNWQWGSNDASGDTDAFFDPAMNDWPAVDDGSNSNNEQKLPDDKWLRKLEIGGEGDERPYREIEPQPELLQGERLNEEEEEEELEENEDEESDKDEEDNSDEKDDSDEDDDTYGENASEGEKVEEEEVKAEEEQKSDEKAQSENSNNEVRVNTRSTDSFPEVFAPTGDSNPGSLPVIATELNDALKNANNLFTAVPGLVNNPALVNSDDVGRRIGKQIQPSDQSPLPTQQQQYLNPSMVQTREAPDVGATANLTNVMEKVLSELEILRESKGVDNMQPEGSPCDVVGTWNSEAIGLQFHISLADPIPQVKAYGMEGKRIEIDITERVPARPHCLLDCDWLMTGIALKQFGGPLYITAQKTERYMVATFAGLCKTCGNIPTIFGAWTFVSPAKDCEDISIVVDTRRDVLRKDTMQSKRKHRMERLHGKTKGKCLACSYR